MPTKTIVRGWVVQFDVGHSGDVIWQEDTGASANSVDAIVVQRSRVKARARLKAIRGEHTAHGHSWIERYRIRRATVTLEVE